MKMIIVQHRDGEIVEWVNCVREDLIDHGGERVPALFYTANEATAYITEMCGLIHMGGNPEDFRLVDVDIDGDRITVRS